MHKEPEPELTMQKTYHLTMNGGYQHLAIEADSAAQAIQRGLEQNPGYRVIGCYAGGALGRVAYEIPKHEPLPPDWKKPRRKIRDDTAMMFDDEAIKAESAKARAAS